MGAPATFTRTPRRLRPWSANIAHADPAVAYGDEPLRALAFRMAETGVTRLPVVERHDRTLVGMVHDRRCDYRVTTAL